MGLEVLSPSSTKDASQGETAKAEAAETRTEAIARVAKDILARFEAAMRARAIPAGQPFRFEVLNTEFARTDQGRLKPAIKQVIETLRGIGCEVDATHRWEKRASVGFAVGFTVGFTATAPTELREASLPDGRAELPAQPGNRKPI